MPDLAARAEDQLRLRRIKAEFWLTLEMNEYRDILNDLQGLENKNAIWASHSYFSHFVTKIGSLKTMKAAYLE